MGKCGQEKMRKVTDFIFISQYCIPIDEIRYIQECDERIQIYLKDIVFPLSIEDVNFKDLHKYLMVLKGSDKL